MVEPTRQLVPAPADRLHAELRALMASSRQRLAGAVNAELTHLYWAVGQRLRTEVLGDARAGYGAKLLDQLGQQLADEFGRGFESRNLRRMVKFAEAFPDAAIVSTLSTKLSWSRLVAIAGRAEPDATANSPAQVFKAPYFLDFLGLCQGHDEGDLEAGITVAEYWTELPPKAELEQTLHAALLEERERLARRRVLLGDLDEE